MPLPRANAGGLLALAGVLIAMSGVVSGPRAFEFGWYALLGSVVAGLLLILSGVFVVRGG